MLETRQTPLPEKNWKDKDEERNDSADASNLSIPPINIPNTELSIH